MTGNSGISLLLDVGFTIQGTTGGDNGNPSRTLAGSPVTFNADRVSARTGRTLADHGTAQDAVEFNRTTKLVESLTIETKLEAKANAPLLSAILGTNGVVVNFIATALGASIEAIAIVESIEWDYDGPSTLRFTLRPYGSPFIISTADPEA